MDEENGLTTALDDIFVNTESCSERGPEEFPEEVLLDDENRGWFFKCLECGKISESTHDGDAIYLNCPHCGKEKKLEYYGIGEVNPDELGEGENQYSFCRECNKVTKNILLAKSTSPMEHDKLTCSNCGVEKEFYWSFVCPKCNCHDYYFISMTDAHYGHDYIYWDEEWKCKCCGEVYTVGNGT